MAQRCCKAVRACVCVCSETVGFVGDGGGGGGHNMVRVTSAGITHTASPVKTKTIWCEWGWQWCTLWLLEKLSVQQIFFFPSRVQTDVILIFTIQFFKNASRWTYCSVRLPYSAQQCILWQWLNDMNRGNIAQFSGLYCVLLSLCNTERSKLWNTMRHMWDLFSGITKLPLKNG